ncbi:SDR family oxidoreductase [Streptomyces chattanoogensis]|uniref:SDR family oxidoreductase n=1 Tax=Streptomyces chattanoogensis TaxID=66876 RepID=UPI0036AE08E0
MTTGEGRSVLVTGGNRGIGLETARAFAAAGDRVAVTYRSAPPPEQEGILPVQCDVTVPEDVERAFKTVEDAHGPVSVLVANAGITADNLMLRMAEEEFASVIKTNLTGTWRVAQRALRGMLTARHGRIIMVSSTAALWGSAGQTNYAAAKAGQVGLARSMAREYGPKNITTNVVAPGLTETDMASALSDRQRDAILGQTPIGRLVQPTEVAAAIRFLADTGAINGTVLPVDGGAGMGH